MIFWTKHIGCFLCRRLPFNTDLLLPLRIKHEQKKKPVITDVCQLDIRMMCLHLATLRGNSIRIENSGSFLRPFLQGYLFISFQLSKHLRLYRFAHKWLWSICLHESLVYKFNIQNCLCKFWRFLNSLAGETFPQYGITVFWLKPTNLFSVTC